MGTDTLSGWKGSVELDFLLNNLASTQAKQNQYLGLLLKSNISYFSQKHQYFTQTELRYFKSRGNDFLNRGYVHFRTNWNRKNKVHSESVLQAQFDNLRNLKFRSIVYTGIKYRVYDNSNHEFDLGSGLMLEYENWLNYGEEKVYTTKTLPKLSTYIGWYTSFNSHTIFSLLQYYQIGYDDQDHIWRHRLNSHVEMTNIITDHVSWIVKFTFQYETDPIIPLANFIYELSNGILITF